MAIISHMSVDYDAPVVEVQSDSSATDLENAKVPTGQTIKSYLNTNNNIVPISENDYAALTPAQKQNGKAYFRYEAAGPMRDIQDDVSATNLNSGDLPTGQTIKSYLNSNLGLFRFRNLGTLSADVLTIAKSLLGSGRAEILFYHNSNNPANQPSGCSWGSYLFISSNTMVTIIYCDKSHIACTYTVTSATTSIDWHIT